MMTSLPLGNSKALRANRPAQEPEVVSTPYLTPRNLLASASIFLASGPACQPPLLIDCSTDFIIALYSRLSHELPPYLICFILSLYPVICSFKTFFYRHFRFPA